MTVPQPPTSPSGEPSSTDRPEFIFGEGKISGVLAATFGALGLGAVVVMLFPEYLSTPEARAAYPMGLIRWTVQFVLAAAFALGLLSVLLSRRRVLGTAGMVMALAATLLGGAQVEIETPVRETHYLGLDWFLLNLLLLALVFVPLERMFAQRGTQRIFREGWKTDLAHFGVSHLLVQITVLVTMLPATLFFRWAVSSDLQTFVSSQPLVLQFFECLFVADLFAYLAHRLFHQVPFLWRFHAIHHSSETLDWLASSRLHVVDIVVTRAFGFFPLYLLGFSSPAIYAYLVWASFQGILVHSNVRFEFGPLKHLFVTPRFHHWHHTAEPPLDRNFAVHLPVIDRIFGTHFLPERSWPERYGIEGSPVPERFLSHLAYPFRSRRRRRETPEA